MFRQIQKRPLGSTAIPLFLFHDASGTISSYYALGPMGRDVYAIANARMESDEPESMRDMGRRYYAAIKAVVPKGRIMLGGWSLGGMIALQAAWICVRDPSLAVDAIFMVDSPFPDYRHVEYMGAESPISEDAPSLAKMKLEKSILQTVNTLHSWQPPVWRRQRQPYTVMLCATENVQNEGYSAALSFVDQFRDSPTLGWNERASSIVIDKSYPIKGHHFNVLEPKNVAFLTETIATIAEGIDLVSFQEDDE